MSKDLIVVLGRCRATEVLLWIRLTRLSWAAVRPLSCLFGLSRHSHRGVSLAWAAVAIVVSLQLGSPWPLWCLFESITKTRRNGIAHH
jgi:hypothetical protein